MKKIEDIEMMEVEDLLKVASDNSVPVPSGLESRIAETLLSQKIAEDAGKDDKVSPQAIVIGRDQT
jgi:hypothetical protein